MPDKALAAHIRRLGEVPEQPDTYRGWSVYRGRWPEPAFMALGPNYDASYEGEETGWTDNGEKADGKTWEAVCAEIDAWFEENEPILNPELAARLDPAGPMQPVGKPVVLPRRARLSPIDPLNVEEGL